ncbi:hypothetical protein E5S70_29890 [Ensifer adhaerens]|nr:hypothetical protein [Ensifer canadensis]
MQMYAYQQQAAQAQQSSYVYQPQVIQPNVYIPMQTPQVAQLNHGSNQVRCITRGIYTNCR